MTTATAHPTSSSFTSLRNLPRGAVIVLGVVLLAVGAWLFGNLTAPSRADANRERSAARAAAYSQARSEAAAPAYADAFQGSFDAGASDGRVAGAADARTAAAAKQTSTG